MAQARVISSVTPSRPSVLHFHSPGAFPFEVDSLAALGDEAGLSVIGVEREALEVVGARRVATVASAVVHHLDDALPSTFSVLAWSGGAPFALATAAQFPQRVRKAVLACPLPGWLRGKGAISAESPRLAAIADGSLSGVPGAEELDVLAEPWGFELDEVRCPVTVWYGGQDLVIPPTLVESQLGGLAAADLVLYPDDNHFLPMGKWTDLLALAAS